LSVIHQLSLLSASLPAVSLRRTGIHSSMSVNRHRISKGVLLKFYSTLRDDPEPFFLYGAICLFLCFVINPIKNLKKQLEETSHKAQCRNHNWVNPHFTHENKHG
jgi:hypothetical protein